MIRIHKPATPPGVETLEDRRMLRVVLLPNEIQAETDETNVFDVIPRLVQRSEFDATHPKYTAAIPAQNNDADPNNDIETLWTSSSSWVGNVVPPSGARVSIPNKAKIVYDQGEGNLLPGNVLDTAHNNAVSMWAIEVGGSLRFDSTYHTVLRVGTLYVLPDSNYDDTIDDAGRLKIDYSGANPKNSTIIFTDIGWSSGNTLGTIDPKHFSGGLVAYGKVTIQGAPHTTTTSGAAGDWAYATGDLAAGLAA
mgnify:CR=1 FL=1